MYKLKLLLNIQHKQLLQSFFPAANQNNKSKLKKWLLALLVFLAIFSLAFSSYMYSSLAADAFAKIDALRLLPGLTLMSASLLMLFTTLYRVKGSLFAFKDYDFLMSLPIKPNTIALSRLIMLYRSNLLVSLILIVPASIAYALRAMPGPYYYLVFILTLFVLPLIPVSLAAVLGTLVHLISSAFKKSNFINFIFSTALFILIMLFSSNTQRLIDSIADIGGEVMGFVNRFYPPADLYVKALCDKNILALFLFIGISLGLFFGFALLLSKFFRPINDLAMQNKNKKEYKEGSISSASPFMALYKREFKRYFSSSPYVMNTSVGLIMFAIMCISLLFTDPHRLELMLNMPGFSGLFEKSGPLLVSFFVAISSTTAASISLEGKSLWILKSMPLGSGLILNSKIALNLTLSVPISLICASILSYSFDFNATQSVFMFLIPLAYALFAALLGLAANLHFPNFDWKTEVSVIKQSAAVLITTFGGLFAVGLPLILTFALISAKPEILNLITLIAVSALDLILYIMILTRGGKIFSAL